MAGFSSINKSTDYFNTLLYTGNGTTSHAITGVGFQPDWCFIKNRETTDVPNISTSVQGVNKYLITSTGDPLQSGSQNLLSFDADGFTVGTDNQFNVSSDGYVSWNLKAGTTSGITQGGASITPSSYSFNQTSGYSIIAYTGTGSVATLPHGLGVKPACIIIKNLESANEFWAVYHKSLGATKSIYLNATNAVATTSVFMNDTEPTTDVFTIGTEDKVNKTSTTMVAYCFADIQGFSKFGTWKGNGANSFNNRQVGPYIYTGFRPAMVITKSVDSTGDWRIFDNKRDTYNTEQKILYPSDSSAEGSEEFANYYCNGFKIRSTSSSYNSNNENYIYLAFGQGLVGSNGVVGTAR